MPKQTEVKQEIDVTQRLVHDLHDNRQPVVACHRLRRLTPTAIGVLPFILTDIIRMILLVAFPVIALWLPMTMVAAR